MQKLRLAETSRKTYNEMFSKTQHMAFPNNTNPKVQSVTHGTTGKCCLNAFSRVTLSAFCTRKEIISKKKYA